MEGDRSRLMSSKGSLSSAVGAVNHTGPVRHSLPSLPARARVLTEQIAELLSTAGSIVNAHLRCVAVVAVERALRGSARIRYGCFAFKTNTRSRVLVEGQRGARTWQRRPPGGIAP